MFEETEDPEEHWLEEYADFVLALHDVGCVAEAVQDAIGYGIDDDDGARQVAAQLLDSGDTPCRCGPSST
jgi:hypothetical protein